MQTTPARDDLSFEVEGRVIIGNIIWIIHQVNTVFKTSMIFSFRRVILEGVPPCHLGCDPDPALGILFKCIFTLNAHSLDNQIDIICNSEIKTIFFWSKHLSTIMTYRNELFCTSLVSFFQTTLLSGKLFQRMYQPVRKNRYRIDCYFLK